MEKENLLRYLNSLYEGQPDFAPLVLIAVQRIRYLAEAKNEKSSSDLLSTSFNAAENLENGNVPVKFKTILDEAYRNILTSPDKLNALPRDQFADVTELTELHQSLNSDPSTDITCPTENCPTTIKP